MTEKQEQTLVLLKPDAIQRGLAGTIISRIESRGLKMVAAKMLHMSKDLAHKHYAPHVGRPFFDDLIRFICSGPIIAMVWQGPGAVTLIRNTMGSTDPGSALPGTIRGDMAVDIGQNLIHGSDSLETASHEISLFFCPEEILDYPKVIDTWITGS